MLSILALSAGSICRAQGTGHATASVFGSFSDYGSSQTRTHPEGTGASLVEQNGLGATYSARAVVIGDELFDRVSAEGNFSDTASAEAVTTWSDVLTVLNPAVIDEETGSNAFKVFAPRIRGGIKGTGSVEFSAAVSRVVGGPTIQFREFVGPGVGGPSTLPAARFQKAR
nr:Unknown Function [uncultured bacterium]